MSAPGKVKSMLNRYNLRAVNKPQRLNDSTDKSHHVLARFEEGGQTKFKHIKFGQEGVKTNQTPEQREAFKSRHAKNIARGPSSPAYWANKTKWSPSKTRST